MVTAPFLYPCLELWEGNQHVYCQLLSVERILVRVEEVSDDDGTIHDHPTGKSYWFCHQCVHQWVYREKRGKGREGRREGKEGGEREERREGRGV